MQNHAFIKKNSQNGQFATLVAENQCESSLGKGLALVIAALALAFACLYPWRQRRLKALGLSSVRLREGVLLLFWALLL